MSIHWSPLEHKAFLGTFFVSFLALGVSLPAMSLIITSKGFSLSYLGLVLFIYSIVVMFFELPSGVFADAKGRKFSFALGQIFSLIGTMILFSQNIVLLCLGFAFCGLGRAYGSGSLDALFIEKGRSSGETLENLVFSLDVVSALGLCLGSLLGGVLLKIGVNGAALTHPMLITRAALLCLTLIMTVFVIKENSMDEVHAKSVSAQLGLLKKALQDTPFIGYFSLSVIVQGMLLASLESYWQPYLKTLLVDDSLLWILGMVSAFMFAASLTGSFFGKLLLRHCRAVVLYCLLFVLVFVLQLFLTLTFSRQSFIALFCLVYLLIGMLSVVGMYVMNVVAKDEVRTSLLSLSSFCIQSGGVFINLLATLLLGYGGIILFWRVCAAASLILILLLSKPLLQRFPRITGQ